MDEIEIEMPELKLPPVQQCVVLVVGTIVGFAADYYSKKGLTAFLLSRQS